MLFTVLFSFLAVTAARSLRGLEETTNVTYTLQWANSDSISSTWQTVASDRDTGKNIVASDANSNTYISKDFGVTFALTSTPKGQSFYSMTSDSTGQYVAAGSGSQGVYISKDYGATWAMSACPAYGSYFAIGSSLKAGAAGTDWIIVAVGSTSGVYITKNTGSTWTNISPVTVANGAYFGSGIGVNIHGQVIQVTYTSGSATTLYLSTSNGTSWNAITSPAGMGPVSASYQTGQYLVAGGTGAIYVSSNYGVTWTASAVPDSSVTYTYSAMNMDGKFAAIVGGSSIYFSSDYGATWTLTNAPAKTYTDITVDLVGDRWVTASDVGRVIVGIVKKK